MLHEDFNTACRLLHKMAAHKELQSDYVPTYSFKYAFNITNVSVYIFFYRPQINHLCACFHEGRCG